MLYFSVDEFDEGTSDEDKQASKKIRLSEDFFEAHNLVESEEEDVSSLEVKRNRFSKLLAVNKIKHEEYEASHKKRGRGRPKKSVGKDGENVFVQEIFLPRDAAMCKSAKIKKEKQRLKPEEEYVDIQELDLGRDEGIKERSTEAVVVEDMILPKYECKTTLKEEPRSRKSKEAVILEEIILLKPVVEPESLPSDEEFELVDVVEVDESDNIPDVVPQIGRVRPRKQAISSASVNTIKIPQPTFPVKAVGRGKPRKQALTSAVVIKPSSQCTSTPYSKPYPIKNAGNLNLCTLTPIKQEISFEAPPHIEPKAAMNPPKASFSYLLRSPETSYANSSMDDTNMSIETETIIKDEVQSPKRLKNVKKKAHVDKKHLEKALEELLDDENDDDLNEKLSKALENSRNEEILKENRMRFGLTKALENRRGQIQKQIAMNKPKGRGRPKGSKKNVSPVKTCVTVLTADDDFQDESIVDIPKELEIEVEPSPTIQQQTIHSPPKILQRKEARKSVKEVQTSTRELKKSEMPKETVVYKKNPVAKESLADLLKKRSRKTRMANIEEEPPHQLEPSETIEEDEFVKMVFLVFD